VPFRGPGFASNGGAGGRPTGTKRPPRHCRAFAARRTAGSSDRRLDGRRPHDAWAGTRAQGPPRPARERLGSLRSLTDGRVCPMRASPAAGGRELRQSRTSVVRAMTFGSAHRSAKPQRTDRRGRTHAGARSGFDLLLLRLKAQRNTRQCFRQCRAFANHALLPASDGRHNGGRKLLLQRTGRSWMVGSGFGVGGSNQCGVGRAPSNQDGTPDASFGRKTAQPLIPLDARDAAARQRSRSTAS